MGIGDRFGHPAIFAITLALAVWSVANAQELPQ